MYCLAFAKKHSKVRHKILKHQENFFFLKIGLDELWAPLSKHSLFDDLKVNEKGN